MRRSTAIALAILVVPSLVACRSGTIGSATEIGSGRAATETREVGTFDRLDASSAVSVVVTVGGPVSVKVTADDNLVDNVVASVSGDRLIVGMNGSVSTRVPVTVDVVVPTLSAVHAGSASTVEIEGLATDRLQLDADSAGRIIAAGSAPKVDLHVGSAGQLRLHDLAVDDATVSIDSAGQAWLRATQGVTGSVTSAGSLMLVGKPATVDVSTDLTGNVVQQ
jgi:hypothetical protein